MSEANAGEETASWQQLPQLIADTFNFEELRALCFELKINYEALGEELGIVARSLALVNYTVEHNCADDLIAALRKHRPHIDWPDVPDDPRLREIKPETRKWGRGVWLVGAITLLATIGGLVWAWFILNQLPPMGDGFNVAVAQFTTVGANNRHVITDVSAKFSTWLFETIDNEMDQLPAALRVNTRGPKDIGAILGNNQEMRTIHASQVADKHNATILVYGFVTEADNDHQVNLEFYVSDRAFNYGSEIAGPDRLGQPIPVTVPLAPGNLTATNQKLRARIEALQYVVTGLSKYFIGQYEQAWADFKWAADIEEWPPEEGKEVAYLLMGTTKLRAYDPLTAPEHLSAAGTAFDKARELNPYYTRVYLGLGALALEKAQIVDDSSGKITTVDPHRLIDAEGFFQTSLSASDQQVSAYITAKAAFGLGQTHLLGWEHGVPGWSGEEAWDAFDQVIQIYESAGEPHELAYYAAHAHANRGLLAGHNDDWQTMIRESREAIRILNSLDVQSLNNWIARYWSWIAIAESELGRVENAQHAYNQAIEIGSGHVSATELEKWQETQTDLDSKGAP